MRGGAASPHGTPGRQHSAAQRAAREAAERRAEEAEEAARALRQQLAGARRCAKAAQASLQAELDTLTVLLTPVR